MVAVHAETRNQPRLGLVVAIRVAASSHWELDTTVSDCQQSKRKTIEINIEILRRKWMLSLTD